MRQLPPASSKPNRAVAALMQWVEANDFPEPLPDDTPSPAALNLFTVITTNKRNLRIRLRSTPPTISVSIHAILPNSRPAIINTGCDALRLILWHVTRNSKSLPQAKCGFACDGSCLPTDQKSRFHLSHVFKPTTNHHKPAKRPRKPNCVFLSLPDDLLLKIIFLLNPSDFVALSDAHPYLHDFLLPIVPGLTLRLFPHQLHALSRMSVMETTRYQDFPLLEQLPSQNLQGYVMTDLVDGSIMLLDSIPRAKLPVGGLFCDEPGLGKTITALSLVLRTAGRRREVPPNTTTSAFTAPNGKVVISYKDNHVRRLSIYGKSTRDYPARKARLLPELSPGKRRSSRSVRIPDFLNKNKGAGSVPVVEDYGQIYLSGGSLIGVPTVLVGHWQSQIEQHVETDTVQVLYIRSKHDLPKEAIVLATYDIVLVSYEVLESIYNDLRNCAPALLQVQFRRVIVDEGHRLSAASVTKFMSVCDRLRADARWVMTGTPTPATPRSDIECLQPLLSFIHEEGYGLDNQAWRFGIRDPYFHFKSESLERLTKLMGKIMIRADKSILKSKCHIKNVMLEFSEETAESYNGLVRMARRNLITSDWFDPEHKESLLNSKNEKESRAVMANLRKACCFGGTMDVNFNRDDIGETLDELYEKYRRKAGLNENDRFKDPTMESHLLNYDLGGEDELERRRREDIQRRVQLFESLRYPPLRLSRYFETGQNSLGQNNLLRSVARMAYTGKLQEIGSALLNCLCECAKCGTETKYPLVTPCAHMLCDECIEKSKTACPVDRCGVRYRMDKKHVPEDLIELQPSIQSHQWRDDWADTKSSKMIYLIKRIESLPHHEEWAPGGQEPILVPAKVIVHSEYGDHLKLVALHMKESTKLRDAYAEMVINMHDIHHETKGIKKASEYAIRSVKKFAEDPKTQVLLMNTKHGALGLDLSFVQYIFLLEPLWDAANELQIISRAHRIGCKDNIYVERLVMKGSVEEDIVADLERSRNQEGESLSDIAKDKLVRDFRKTSDLLRNLKVVNFEAGNDCGEGSNLSGSSRGNDEGLVEQNVIQDDIIVIDDTDDEVNDSSDSGPGASEIESSESRLSGCISVPPPRGVLKRRRPQREHSAEPRRVRFRE